MICECCPFNDGINEEATDSQDLGCLPSKFDMLNLLHNEEIALSCHDRQNIACRGLAKVANVRKARVWPYSNWFKGDKICV
jgi:hypothetical protein